MYGVHVDKPPTWSKQQQLPALKHSLHHIWVNQMIISLATCMEATIIHCRYTHINSYSEWNSAKVSFTALIYFLKPWIWTDDHRLFKKLQEVNCWRSWLNSCGANSWLHVVQIHGFMNVHACTHYSLLFYTDQSTSSCCTVCISPENWSVL